MVTSVSRPAAQVIPAGSCSQPRAVRARCRSTGAAAWRRSRRPSFRDLQRGGRFRTPASAAAASRRGDPSRCASGSAEQDSTPGLLPSSHASFIGARETDSRLPSTRNPLGAFSPRAAGPRRRNRALDHHGDRWIHPQARWHRLCSRSRGCPAHPCGRSACTRTPGLRAARVFTATVTMCVSGGT
jgi:hypothetical protein